MTGTWSRTACFVAGWLSLALGSDAIPQDPSTDAALGPKVDALFQAYGRTTPGAVVAVMRAGVVVYSHAYGMADLERGVPLTTDSVFNIASMSKQFTGMCIALLVERGKLKLGDEIHRYLPELHAYGHPITVSHLLHHTSGLKDYGQILQRGDWAAQDPVTRDRTLPLVFHQSSLNFVPGDEFEYSDTNYLLLAVIVERVSGQSFATFARREIFEPLGMTQTRVCDDATAIVPNRALGYTRSGPGWQNGESYSEVGGEGDIFTTVGDLAKWDANFYERKVGGVEAHEIMVRTEPLNDGYPNEYAAGLKIQKVRGLNAIEHSGGEIGYDVDMIRFPDQRWTAAVLTNDRDDSRPKSFVQRIAALYLSNLAGTPEPRRPEPFAVDPKELETYVGLYWDGQTDSVRRFQLVDGALANSKCPSGAFTPMTPVGPGRFVRGLVDYTFTGTPPGMTRGTPGLRPVAYRRVEPIDTDADAIRQWTGGFYCEDADIRYRIEVDSGHLILQRKGRADERLEPAFRDAYFGDPGLLVFRRSDDGKIRLAVMGERLRSLDFVRL